MLRFLLCCAFAALALSAGASAFDESLAKDALMWSSGAYGSSPKDCPYNDDFEVLNVLELNSNMCMVGYSETFDSVVLSCRGTNSISQLTKEIMDSSPVPFPYSGFSDSVSVVSYFYKHFNDMSSMVVDAVQAAHAAHPNAGFICTGHSLGGALATLHAASMSHIYSGISLITFGSPRVGNWDFAQMCNQDLGTILRVTHRKDSVVHVPWCPGGVVPGATCGEMDSDASWPAFGFHLAYETYYPSDMPSATSGQYGDYKSCTSAPIGEDTSCSDNWWLPDSISDHLHYYDIEVGQACDNHLRARGFEGVPAPMSDAEKAQDHLQAVKNIKLMQKQAVDAMNDHAALE